MKQIAVFLENRNGRIAETIDLLMRNQIGIKGFFLADKSDYGVLRLIVDRVDDAYTLLAGDGDTVHVTDVIALHMDNTPGSLASILSLVGQNGISIEYAYDLIDTNDGFANIIFQVNDYEKTVQLFKEKNVAFS